MRTKLIVCFVLACPGLAGCEQSKQREQELAEIKAFLASAKINISKDSEVLYWAVHGKEHKSILFRCAKEVGPLSKPTREGSPKTTRYLMR